MTKNTKNSLLSSDPVLERLIETLDPPNFESTDDVFHDLVGCIIEQQIHYRSTKKIYQRLLEKAGIDRLTLSNFSLFEEKAIPTLKLSMKKLETVHNWVNYCSTNNINWQELDDKAIREQLSTIKGIGPWTMDMILMYTLKRPTIFPVDDFHLKQIMTSLYQLDATSKLKAQMNAIAETWGNNQSLAVMYLLEWKKKNKI